MHHISKLAHKWVNFHVSLGFVVWGIFAFKQPVCIWIWECDSKISQSHNDMKSINYVSLLETFEETEKGVDFTQRRARKEFADRCFGRELTLQQVTLKVICFLHPQCPWHNCSSFKCLYNIVIITVLVIEADFPAFARSGWRSLHFAGKCNHEPFWTSLFVWNSAEWQIYVACE